MYIKKYNILFLHIPKTAGSSVTKYMEYLGGDDYYQKTLPSDFSCSKWVETYTHLPLKYYNEFLTDEQVESAIKFTVIRNPLDRLKSWYFYNKIKGWVDLPINKFLPQIYKEINLLLERGYCLDYTNRNNCGSLYNTLGIMKQSDFFDSNDNISLLKFENLQIDFNKFVSKYNLPKYDIPNINPSVQISRQKFTKEMVLGHSKHMLNFVLDYYSTDFEIWKKL